MPRCPQNNHNYKSQTTSSPAIITLALMNCLDPRHCRHHPMSPGLMSPRLRPPPATDWVMTDEMISLLIGLMQTHGDSLTCKQLLLSQTCSHNKSRNPLKIRDEEIWRPSDSRDLTNCFLPSSRDETVSVSCCLES